MKGAHVILRNQICIKVKSIKKSLELLQNRYISAHVIVGAQLMNEEVNVKKKEGYEKNHNRKSERKKRHGNNQFDQRYVVYTCL